MFLEGLIPKQARDAYRHDAWAGLLGGVYTGAIFPFVLFVARDRLHASVPLISLMTSAPFIGSLFALLYAGIMEGRQKMPFLIWPQAIARALFLLVIFATTPERFAILITVVHTLGAIGGPAYAAILKEIYPDEYRGQIMAYVRVGLAATTFFSTLVVGRLLSGFEVPLACWDIPPVNFFYICAVAGLIGVGSTLIFSRIRTESVLSENQTVPLWTVPKFIIKTFSIFKTDRQYAWFALSIFTFGFGNLLAAPLYPVYQVDRLHISAGQVALLSNISTIVWIFSYFYWGKYVDARSPLRAVMVNVLLVSGVPLVYFLAQNPWMLIPAAIISGATMGGIDLSYFNSILYFSKEGQESQYQALHSFLLGIRGTMAPFVGALVISCFRQTGVDVKYVFLLSMVLMLVGAAFQVLGVRQKY